MLVVDAANVVGSRPNGWWRDRGKAARDLCNALAEAREAGRLESHLVVVLEGAARHGVAEQEGDDVRVVHATGSGDDTIVEVAAAAMAAGDAVTVVTADRELKERVRRLGAETVGPRWFLDRIES